MILSTLAVVGALAAGPFQTELRAALPVLASPPLSTDDLWKAWPAAARSVGLEASVSMTCVITVAGMVEACSAVTETKGSGFEAAAISLAPALRFTPATIDGKAIPLAMSIPIAFTCRDQCRPFAVGGAIVLYPAWIKTPQPDEIAAVYPPSAAAEGVEGTATLLCRRLATGELEACSTTEEAPLGRGFGDAALKLAAGFRGPAAKGRIDGEVFVRARVSFKPGAGQSSAGTLAPGETRPAPSPPEAEKTKPSAQPPARRFYPEIAASRDVRDSAIVICRGNPDLSPASCVAAQETPPGFGFGKAGAELSTFGSLQPRIVDGKIHLDEYIVAPVSFGIAR